MPHRSQGPTTSLYPLGQATRISPNPELGTLLGEVRNPQKLTQLLPRRVWGVGGPTEVHG